MENRAPSVGELVARFQLRRRASTDAFHDGVRLARSGLVTITAVAPDLVTADVRDSRPLQVALSVEAGSLVGRCPCPAATHSICRHQVAVAHKLWVSRRRYRGPLGHDEAG